ARLLSIAFTGQRLLDAEFLARLQVKGVPFDFPDDILVQNFPLEAAEGVLQRLAILEVHLSQRAPPALTMIPNTAIQYGGTWHASASFHMARPPRRGARQLRTPDSGC